MSTKWYIKHSTDELSPVSFQDLVDLTRQGLLTECSLVRPEYATAWCRVDDVIGLLHMARRTQDPVACTQSTQSHSEIRDFTEGNCDPLDSRHLQPGTCPVSSKRYVTDLIQFLMWLRLRFGANLPRRNEAQPSATVGNSIRECSTSINQEAVKPAIIMEASMPAVAAGRDSESLFILESPCSQHEVEHPVGLSRDVHQAILLATARYDSKTLSQASAQHNDGAKKSFERIGPLRTGAGMRGRARRHFLYLWERCSQVLSFSYQLTATEAFNRLLTQLLRPSSSPTARAAIIISLSIGCSCCWHRFNSDEPDELDRLATRSVRDAYDSILAMRTVNPSESEWNDFSRELLNTLQDLKATLKQNLDKNRPIKEGLYLALEFRLPRILKEGRLTPSDVERELAHRLNAAEQYVKTSQY